MRMTGGNCSAPAAEHHPCMLPGRVSAELATTIASAAVPYGYTVSLGGSIALASERLGAPHVGGALLLMSGAVAGFVLLDAATVGARSSSDRGEPPTPSVWRNAHVPSIGAALGLVWAVVHVFGGPLAWGLTGLAATATYFLVTACQNVATAALRRPARGGRR